MRKIGLDTLFDSILTEHTISPAIYKTAQYFYDNQGNDLNYLANKCLQDGVNKKNITACVSFIQKHIGCLIKKEYDEQFLASCKEEIIKRALKKEISFKKYISSAEYGNWFLGTPLSFKRKQEKEMKGVDRVEECLKWLNCLIEFYCGESLVQENIPDQDSNITIEKTRKNEQEQEVIYSLWKKGYLNCDLKK